jgi:intracellular sulfur oxidation DsrE/DsrF family protein
MRALFILLFCIPPALHAADAPWGHGQLDAIDYPPMKGVYDVNVSSVDKLESVLDRASYLTQITGVDPFVSSTVLVLHGPEIDFFAISNTDKYRELMTRVKGLIDSDLIDVRMCRIAARSRGFEPEDIHGFVTLVPMGDAEIVRLQYVEGHAYMR